MRGCVCDWLEEDMELPKTLMHFEAVIHVLPSRLPFPDRSAALRLATVDMLLRSACASALSGMPTVASSGYICMMWQR
jgi:hypothetical protein